MPKTVPIDSDAEAFITATGISGTNANAINQLVLDLKAASIWSKMKAVYPIIGGTATTHKFNLLNPQDTDAAFRLVFNGGVTHSSSGVLFNGTNGWANTFLNMSLEYSNQYDISLSCNIYNDYSGTGSKGHIGCQSTASSNFRLGATSSTNEISLMGTTSFSISKTVTSTTHKGFWCGSRTANNVHNFIDPTGVIDLNTNTVSSTLPNLTIGLGCRRGTTNDMYSAFGYSFFSTGVGLTTAEMTALRTAEINFQTTLGRI